MSFRNMCCRIMIGLLSFFFFNSTCSDSELKSPLPKVTIPDRGSLPNLVWEECIFFGYKLHGMLLWENCQPPSPAPPKVLCSLSIVSAYIYEIVYDIWTKSWIKNWDYMGVKMVFSWRLGKPRILGFGITLLSLPRA